MRVQVDHERCAGYASCEIIAPEVFEVGDDNLARVLDDHPAEALRAGLEKAVRDCPARAITLDAG